MIFKKLYTQEQCTITAKLQQAYPLETFPSGVLHEVLRRRRVSNPKRVEDKRDYDSNQKCLFLNIAHVAVSILTRWSSKRMCLYLNIYFCYVNTNHSCALFGYMLCFLVPSSIVDRFPNRYLELNEEYFIMIITYTKYIKIERRVF